MSKDRQFQQQIRQTLDRQTVDTETRDSLRSARMNALDRESHGVISGWIPATAVAGLLVVLVGFLVTRDEGPAALPQMTAEELAVIASEDELELLEELEFYIWFDKDKNV